MKLSIIGSGYVGLVTGTCFAEMGNTVICVDNDARKIEGLRQGKLPIYEPGLEPLVISNSREGRLRFTTSIAEAVAKANVHFIAVGTPPGEDGSADLQYVLAAARELGRLIHPGFGYRGQVHGAGGHRATRSGRDRIQSRQPVRPLCHDEGAKL